QIHKVLQQATVECSSQVEAIFQVLETKESPPTYFCTNKFTSAFQEIVDAYGYGDSKLGEQRRHLNDVCESGGNTFVLNVCGTSRNCFLLVTKP
ncbi:hypothetical protein VIGAN_01193900, partial [Vigna angularis var. angularis]